MEGRTGGDTPKLAPVKKLGGSGPDCGAVNSPLKWLRISRQKFSLQRVGFLQFVTQMQASDSF